MIRRALWPFAVAVAVVVVTGGGCSDGGAADAGPPDMMAPTEAEIVAERPYYPTIPADYDPSKKYPLVLVLAGFGGVGTDTAAYFGYTDLAVAQDFFLVAPDADPLHARFAWNPNAAQYPEFDVLYLTAIIHDLESKYSIDHGRVYVTGHSQGGEMAHRMGCDASADVAAIVSLAGQVTKDPSECAPTNLVSALEIHGTDDTVIGYNGDVQNSPPDPTIPSAHETIAVWGRNDGCTGALAATSQTYDLVSNLDGAETTVEAYSGCPTGIGVELWSIQNGMHHPLLSPDFATATWAFLTAHATPAR